MGVALAWVLCFVSAAAPAAGFYPASGALGTHASVL
jgi:hypothetical protein